MLLAHTYLRCLVRSLLVALSTAALPAVAANSDIERAFSVRHSSLGALYARYPQFQTQLTEYVYRQNFRAPAEAFASIVHELIHIDSAAHRAYFIDGAYYEPYLAPDAWPLINNKDVATYLTREQVLGLGPLHSNYLLNTPRNTLGNVIDEINAYSQTLPFICTEAPAQAPVHVRALAGHLTLADDYLGLLATRYPDQYRALAKHRTARGALETVIANGYTALNQCFRAGIVQADPRPIPKAATRAFSDEPQPR